MPLNDVWNKVNRQIGFYTIDNFDKIPNVPGVYAWFYPLRITTMILEDFLDQVNVVLNYDSNSLGKPVHNAKLLFSWEEIMLSAEVANAKIPISTIRSSWDSICQSQNFENFRRIIMKSSIFLPPLYVGKSKCLHDRCQQHINGRNSGNNFNSRFENYARAIPHATSKNVSDLLFVCVKTEELSESTDDVEGLIETILKYLAKPKYSKL
jgi:hypothetical protein